MSRIRCQVRSADAVKELAAEGAFVQSWEEMMDVVAKKAQTFK